MDFREFIKDHNVYFDGAMGTRLQELGLSVGEPPEKRNIISPEIIIQIHKEYFDAGANVIATNTFGANVLKFPQEELEEIIASAIKNAKKAKLSSSCPNEKFIALDIGPLGKLLRPYGDLDFEDAVNIFKQTISLGVRYGIDLILIETMTDSYETKAALLAAKEVCDLPTVVTNAYEETGKLLTGTSVEGMVAMLEGMGADMIGINCSLGPKALTPIAKRMLDCASVPIVFKPNAGLPKVVDGKTVYNVNEENFANDIANVMRLGARGVGGCCGTTPIYIKTLVEKTKNIPPCQIKEKTDTVISSFAKVVNFNNAPILIGERINPTGKKRLKEALLCENMDYILEEGSKQEEAGAHVLDVNVGLPEIDEKRLLTRAVCELQAVIELPLQIDTSNAEAMEAALRRYNGKALINSVNGKTEVMDKIFPLAKKYGGAIIALTLDEDGIPADAEGRVKIARKILSYAEKWDIKKKDIIFDTLALSVSADPTAANQSLKAINLITNELGAHTSLGISNVSFGLPSRDSINSTFLALALSSGLSAAIINPFSAEVMQTYYAYRALNCQDSNFEDYILHAGDFHKEEIKIEHVYSDKKSKNLTTLQQAIVKGFREKAATITKESIKSAVDALDIIHDEIIPALDVVGRGFENGSVYLPQLLMSAEAAKCAFEEIKTATAKSSPSKTNSQTVVIATVKGDIHDIGKNIVKLLLENYGFRVIDLGRDVSEEEILDAAKKHSAKLVGLSALMTTTVVNMAKTIRLLKEKLPETKIVVGGAVLTEEYAKSIGADKYAKDAMETVRYAELIFSR